MAPRCRNALEVRVLPCSSLAALEVLLLKGIRLKRKKMTMEIVSSDAMAWAQIKGLPRPKGCAGFW
jgi:hypothetical protein